ncbi:MAG: hypothetical protein KAH04_07495, partial [Psychrilyobacter sp.]|nr:hypothetical protein [Psychrilyobacter sp.]
EALTVDSKASTTGAGFTSGPTGTSNLEFGIIPKGTTTDAEANTDVTISGIDPALASITFALATTTIDLTMKNGVAPLSVALTLDATSKATGSDAHKIVFTDKKASQIIKLKGIVVKAAINGATAGDYNGDVTINVTVN